jgi:hypothetical protein
MKARLVSCEKIWEQGEHNAFTDLTRFEDKWFCTFREARDHMSLDGIIRIIASADGVSWSSASVLTTPDLKYTDLRDPKLGVTPDGRLMLMGAACSHGEIVGRQTYVWFSDDGRDWSEAEAAGAENDWIWSLTWADNHAYGAGYNGAEESVYLYESATGTQFKKLTTLHKSPRYPNETALLFEGDDALAVVRREFAEGQTSSPPYNNGTALLAQSQAPFQEWTTHDLGVYIGGPAILRLPNGSVVVAGRKTVPEHLTTLWEVDVAGKAVRELITVPSGGDCSYPGLVWHDDLLWMSYYSSHEDKTNIYLAQIEIG